MLASYLQKDNFLVSMSSKVKYLIATFLKNFSMQHYLRPIDEIEHSLALPFFGIGMKTDVFQPCGHCRVFQICCHVEGITLTVPSFWIWKSSAEIPSPPLAWFVVLLSKAHLTWHFRMSSSRWETTPSWLSVSLRPFLYSFSVYSCHLFLISSAFIGSLPFLSFILLIFAWNIPLVSPIFLKRALLLLLSHFSHVRLRVDPIDGSPPGSPIPGILQARILEWVAISFSNAWKWKVKVKSPNHVRPLATPWTAAYQAPPSLGFSRQEYWSGLPLPSPEKSSSLSQNNCGWWLQSWN